MPALSSKRQITLPKELCDRLQVASGDALEVFEHKGRITILKKQKGSIGSALVQGQKGSASQPGLIF